MFNLSVIKYFYLIAISNTHNPIKNWIYCYNEDVKDIQNFHLISWEKSESLLDMRNLTIRLSMEENFDNYVQLMFWKTAVDKLNISLNTKIVRSYIDILESITFNKSDVGLVLLKQRAISESLMPFMIAEYGIYYKIKDFYVSPLFFLEGLTFQLWMYCVSTFIGIFIGFMILARVYNHYLKLKNSSSKVVLYQANFICNQRVSDYLDKFLSWRILVITGFIFNCIFMVAFTAKFITNMSIQHFEQPFNNLEDFARLRTHVICIPANMLIMKNFRINKNGYPNTIHPKWKDILNPPMCKDFMTKYTENICNDNNVAFIYPTHMFNGQDVKCAVMELKGFFSSEYGSIAVNQGFKYKEQMNVAFLKLQEVGIVDRTVKRFGIKKNPLNNFQDPYSEKYNVQDEGVMFDHVKYIVIIYFSFLPIPMAILLIEIFIHKYKARMIRLIDQLTNSINN
ncbi:unnamed protein product [Diamesa serratosioi]